MKISTNIVRKTFDNYATEFDNWFIKNKELYVSELKALKATRPKGLILDIGVGSGVFASKISASVGIDVSRQILKISQSRGLEVIQADATALPFRNHVFDTVVVTFTVCFVEDVTRMLVESSRVLKVTGMLVLGEITLDSAWGKLYSKKGKGGHRFYRVARFLTFRKTVSFLAATGFTIEKIFATLSFSPQDRPQVQEPVELSPMDYGDIKRYGFICLVAKPTV